LIYRREGVKRKTKKSKAIKLYPRVETRYLISKAGDKCYITSLRGGDAHYSETGPFLFFTSKQKKALLNVLDGKSVEVGSFARGRNATEREVEHFLRCRKLQTDGAIDEWIDKPGNASSKR
jgi:hypothetical protein